jgi:hypothetical protein
MIHENRFEMAIAPFNIRHSLFAPKQCVKSFVNFTLIMYGTLNFSLVKKSDYYFLNYWPKHSCALQNQTKQPGTVLETALACRVLLEIDL